MAHILYTDDTTKEISPDHPEEGFDNETIHSIVGGYYEVVPTGDSKWLLLVNEDGNRLGLPKNERASILAHQYIVGNVMLITKAEIK